jgi:hypothetical protein
MTWITNHPKPIQSLWPRRAANYVEGLPKASEKYSVKELENQGLIGIYVDMSREDYDKLPILKRP